jgi:hypothetical protein
MAARPAIGKGGILLRPDPVEAIEKPIERISLHLVGLVVGFFILLGIESKNFQFDEHQLPLNSAVLRFRCAVVNLMVLPFCGSAVLQ